ncbi:retrovirus-related pol polyprotein from transposon TNT 1-94 [Tanacetum coccineum]
MGAVRKDAESNTRSDMISDSCFKDKILYDDSIKFIMLGTIQVNTVGCFSTAEFLLLITGCVVFSFGLYAARYDIGCNLFVLRNDVTIRREESAKTPQQNGVAERKNRTLIEAARTMLADLLLPIVFWAEAVNTTCYVLNRVLVKKPHNKTPYELIIDREPSISFMRPFGCPITILNTLDPLEKEATEQLDAVRKEFEAQCNNQEKITRASSTNSFNTVSTPVNTASASRTFSLVGPSSGPSFVPFGRSFPIDAANLSHDPLMHELEYTAEIYKADFNNIEPSTVISPIPSTRVHSIHPKAYIIGDPQSRKVEAIRKFLAFASFMNFPMYQMDVKSSFLYGTIKEEVYICQPPGFVDLEFLEKVYKVENALYGLHQAPRAWYETLSTYLLDNGFHRGQIDETLFIRDSRVVFYRFKSCRLISFFGQIRIKQKEGGILHSSGQLLVNLEEICFSSVRIVTMPGACLDKKLQQQVVQYLGLRLISWLCKKQTMVANSTTKAEYIAASHYYLLTKAFDVSRFNFLVASIGRDTKIPQSGGPLIKVGDEAVHKELGNRMERAATTASSFEADQGTVILNQLFIHQMADLEFYDKHNMVAYLVKSKGSEGFHEIIDFLTSSHIYYALTECPTLYLSLIEQFWQTAALSTIEDGVRAITATIDGRDKIITEVSIRRHLKLQDSEGLTSLPNAEIFKLMARHREKNSADTEVLLEEETLTELIEDLGSGEKDEKEISTTDVPVSTAGAEVSTAIHDVNTDAVALVYIRRSASKAKDKGKAIMHEPKLQRKLREGSSKMSVDEELAERYKRRNKQKQWQSKNKKGSILKLLWNYKGYLALLIRPYSITEVYEEHENFMYYQIIRADGGSKNYKIFSEMLDDFDRQDVMDLHRLVEERYATSRPEGYDLMLWGDLKILFQPDEEDEVWRHQHEYNLISWRLFDSCGIHILLMDNGIAIHMMIEKKYPLTQEMLSKMLSRKLEVDHENEMAFELLRFIRSQVQK